MTSYRFPLIAAVIALSATSAAAAPPPQIGGQPIAAPQAALDVEAQAARIEQQVNGNFGTLERNALDPLGMIQKSWDRAPSNAGHYEIPWDPDATPKLRIRMGMPLTIVLPEGERPTKDGVVIGADFVKEHARSANRLVFVAQATGIDGAITILGASGRTYPFYVRAEDYRSTAIPDLVVKFRGPPVTPIVSTDTAAPNTRAVPDLANPNTASKLNFAYTMSGDPTLAPDIVFSDGIWTYFRWSTERWRSTDLPSVYRVVDGVDEPLQPPEVSGSTLIVKETGALTLRSGKRFVCIRPSAAPTSSGQPSDRPPYAQHVLKIGQ